VPRETVHATELTLALSEPIVGAIAGALGRAIVDRRREERQQKREDAAAAQAAAETRAEMLTHQLSTADRRIALIEQRLRISEEGRDV